jgi:pyrimidine-specific ribonucleoside hydrolase
MSQPNKIYYKSSITRVIKDKNWILQERPNVVLREYPHSACQFTTDLAPYVDRIIERHGHEEWKAAVLTNEMHRHLGIYSIIGVKMGIRAREILQAGLDELVVDSFTGLHPPVSCMTDGLQVSTGASLGRGTIFVREVMLGEPVAVFRKDGQQIKLILKQPIREEINTLIRAYSSSSAHETHEYFEKIRNISITYWLELDRNDIFEVYKIQYNENSNMDTGKMEG